MNIFNPRIGVKVVNTSDIPPRVMKIVDIIDAYDVMNALSDEKRKETKKEPIHQFVEKDAVKSVLGNNYRINAYKNGDVVIVLKKEVRGYESVEFVQKEIAESPFKYEFDYKAKGSHLFEIKCIINVENDQELEPLAHIFTTVNIE